MDMQNREGKTTWESSVATNILPCVKQMGQLLYNTASSAHCFVITQRRVGQRGQEGQGGPKGQDMCIYR